MAQAEDQRTAISHESDRRGLTAETAHALADRLLRGVDSSSSRLDFVRAVTKAVLECCGVDVAHVWLGEDGRLIECRTGRGGQPKCSVRRFERPQGRGRRGDGATVRRLAAVALGLNEVVAGVGSGAVCGVSAHAALVALSAEGQSVGFLGLQTLGPRRLGKGALGGLDRLASVVGHSLAAQRAQAALHERVKELTCLYGITQAAQHPACTLDEVLADVAALLPTAWQYPEVARARIDFDGSSFDTRSCDALVDAQTAALVVNGRTRGSVQVGYTQPRPTMDEGPFLVEERSLLEAVAVQLSLLVERREAALERAQLEEQLRHADRLATIGLLAAGVAHELNEPLGNILGFAQLARKAVDLPAAAAQDLDKVIAASMHAREVVRKLRLFARQAPPSKVPVNLSQVVDESLVFLEARMAKQSIVLVRRLARDLPVVTADPFQLQQVVVNLVVNAVHAMSDGGELTVATCAGDGHVMLAVEDSGIGMDEEVLGKVFLPFFTTKDVDEGTGLGLSVVHGIVRGHGGAIRVESKPGRGSRFEVEIPLADGTEA